jgi:hypothetical protein
LFVPHGHYSIDVVALIRLGSGVCAASTIVGFVAERPQGWHRLWPNKWLAPAFAALRTIDDNETHNG